MKRVAIVGIQGVPAKYGGFETMVENIIGDNCSSDVQYTVFCGGRDYDTHLATYKGARLKYIPMLHANGAQSTPYDIISLMRCIRGYDTVVVLGVSGCIFLPIFRLLYRKKLVVNIDGLEHRRAKWGKFAKWFLRTSEAMAVRCADVVIADNKGIQDYVWETYHKNATLVTYGGDQALRDVPEEWQLEILRKYGVTAGNYDMTVCRIEPENNSHVICEAFAKNGKDIVFVGNWECNEYSHALKLQYAHCRNIHMLESLYDLDELYALRRHCRHYVHGHSAGGTNPSLVEAMFFGKPIMAYDVVYNRETTENKACYFKTADELTALLSQEGVDGAPMKETALRRYTWKHIAQEYEALYDKET